MPLLDGENPNQFFSQQKQWGSVVSLKVQPHMFPSLSEVWFGRKFGFQLLKKVAFQMSNEKRAGWLFRVYGGWNPTHLSKDYNKPL